MLREILEAGFSVFMYEMEMNPFCGFVLSTEWTN